VDGGIIGKKCGLEKATGSLRLRRLKHQNFEKEKLGVSLEKNPGPKAKSGKIE